MRKRITEEKRRKEMSIYEKEKFENSSSAKFDIIIFSSTCCTVDFILICSKFTRF